MTKKTIYLIPLILLSFWLIPERGYATTISSQLTKTYKDDSGLFGGIIASPTATCGITATVGVRNYLPLGTGLSGLPQHLILSLSEDQGFGIDNTTRFLRACLIESTTNSTTTITGNYKVFEYRLSANDAQQNKTASSTSYGGTWNSSTQLDSSKYYGLTFISSNSQIGRIWGTNSGSYNYICTSTGFTCSSLTSPYFQLLGEETNTTTRIIRNNSPTSNGTVTSDTVTFDYNYYYNSTTGGYTYTGVKVKNILTNFQYTPTELAIIASGETNALIDMALPADSCFSWTPYLRGASTTIEGVSWLFETNDGCDDFQSVVGDNSTTSFFAFLNVPNTLRNKSPVGYIYIMADILNNFSSITASSSVDLSLNLASSSAGYFTGSLDLFSADTIGTYLNTNMTNLLRNFMVVITYITTGMTLFALGRKTFT